MVNFLDTVTLDGVKETAEGYLVADAFAVRTGIQRYAGFEVGRPDMPFVDVYRSESEVFSAATLRSFSHVPVTNDHPTEAVTADNWKDLAVGEASTEVLRDGGKMKIPLVLKDRSAISAVQSGKRQLSAGYSCDLDFTDGVSPEGLPYQASQKNIRANHIAIVHHGRAGSEFRIGDAADAIAWGAAPITNDRETPIMLRKILLDGISIETTDQGAQAIEKLQAQLNDALGKVEKADLVIADKSAEIGKLKIDLKQSQDSVPSGATLDKMVADRAALISAASKIATDAKFDGLSDADIRRLAVGKAFGDDMVADASDAEIVGMFKAATRDGAPTRVATDPVHDTLKLGDGKTPIDVTDHGQKKYEDRVANAWKAVG